MPDRLQLDKRYFPVQTFFNALSNDTFVRTIDHLLSGVGHSVNECDCSFPDDLDPDDERFEGVRFSIFEEELVISLDELRSFVIQACRSQLAIVPEQRLDIERLLGQCH